MVDEAGQTPPEAIPAKTQQLSPGVTQFDIDTTIPRGLEGHPELNQIVNELKTTTDPEVYKQLVALKQQQINQISQQMSVTPGQPNYNPAADKPEIKAQIEQAGKDISQARRDTVELGKGGMSAFDYAKQRGLIPSDATFAPGDDPKKWGYITKDQLQGIINNLVNVGAIVDAQQLKEITADPTSTYKRLQTVGQAWQERHNAAISDLSQFKSGDSYDLLAALNAGVSADKIKTVFGKEATDKAVAAKKEQDDFEADNTKLPDGQYIAKVDLASLKESDPEGYKVLTDKGFNAYQKYVDEFNASVAKENAANKAKFDQDVKDSVNKIKATFEPETGDYLAGLYQKGADTGDYTAYNSAIDNIQKGQLFRDLDFKMNNQQLPDGTWIAKNTLNDLKTTDPEGYKILTDPDPEKGGYNHYVGYVSQLNYEANKFNTAGPKGQFYILQNTTGTDGKPLIPKDAQFVGVDKQGNIQYTIPQAAQLAKILPDDQKALDYYNKITASTWNYTPENKKLWDNLDEKLYERGKKIWHDNWYQTREQVAGSLLLQFTPAIAKLPPFQPGYKAVGMPTYQVKDITPIDVGITGLTVFAPLAEEGAGWLAVKTLGTAGRYAVPALKAGTGLVLTAQAIPTIKDPSVPTWQKVVNIGLSTALLASGVKGISKNAVADLSAKVAAARGRLTPLEQKNMATAVKHIQKGINIAAKTDNTRPLLLAASELDRATSGKIKFSETAAIKADPQAYVKMAESAAKSVKPSDIRSNTRFISRDAQTALIENKRVQALSSQKNIVLQRIAMARAENQANLLRQHNLVDTEPLPRITEAKARITRETYARITQQNIARQMADNQDKLRRIGERQPPSKEITVQYEPVSSTSMHAGPLEKFRFIESKEARPTTLTPRELKQLPIMFKAKVTKPFIAEGKISPAIIPATEALPTPSKDILEGKPLTPFGRTTPGGEPIYGTRPTQGPISRYGAKVETPPPTTPFTRTITLDTVRNTIPNKTVNSIWIEADRKYPEYSPEMKAKIRDLTQRATQHIITTDGPHGEVEHFITTQIQKVKKPELRASLLQLTGKLTDVSIKTANTPEVKNLIVAKPVPATVTRPMVETSTETVTKAAQETLTQLKRKNLTEFNPRVRNEFLNIAKAATNNAVRLRLAGLTQSRINTIIDNVVRNEIKTIPDTKTQQELRPLIKTIVTTATGLAIKQTKETTKPSRERIATTKTIKPPPTGKKPPTPPEKKPPAPPREPIKAFRFKRPPERPRFPLLFTSDMTDSQKRDVIKKSGGAFYWQQGQLRGKKVYHVGVVSGGKVIPTTVLGKPPEGAIRTAGLGQAKRTIRVTRGSAPRSPVKLEGGAIDVVVSPTKTQRGVTIDFVRDPKYRGKVTRLPSFSSRKRGKIIETRIGGRTVLSRRSLRRRR